MNPIRAHYFNMPLPISPALLFEASLFLPIFYTIMMALVIPFMKQMSTDLTNRAKASWDITV
jgi:hypothetical protein